MADEAESAAKDFRRGNDEGTKDDSDKTETQEARKKRCEEKDKQPREKDKDALTFLDATLDWKELGEAEAQAYLLAELAGLFLWLRVMNGNL